MESEIFDLIALLDEWEYQLPDEFLEKANGILEIMLIKEGYVSSAYLGKGIAKEAIKGET